MVQKFRLPGNGGNILLSGYHNIKGEVCRYLLDLGQSDEVILCVSQNPYHYRVAQKVLLRERGMPLEVRRQNAEWIALTDHERLTMVTCWPYSSNTHRLIVMAFPVP